MNNYLISFLFILIFIIGFMLGVGYGAEKIAVKMISISSEVLDIKLSPAAIQLLVNQPELLSYAIKNYQNITNPFIKENERLHFEKCVIEMGNETLCYDGLLSKYGNYTK